MTSPSASKCPVTAAAQPSAFGSSGGSGTLSVTTNRECQWSASASSWIQFGNNASGQGEGTVPFTVTANGDPAQRRGAIMIGDQQVAISQDAAPCVFTVSPLVETVSPAGERRTISVTANGAQCTWTARSETEWLVISEGGQGTGNGQVVYEARATTGPSRTGALTIAGQTVTVTQGIGCSASIAPMSQTVGASGGSGAITVNTAAGCAWSAQSDVPWIGITSGQTGSGPGTVAFAVGAWNGPSRIGTLRVDSHVFTVTQTAGCSFTIAPTSQSVGSGGGTGSVSVRTAGGCGWAALSSVPWITITGGASGSGDGSVQFSVAATTGAARSGSLTIAGHVFTVSQSSGCTFSLNPTTLTVGAGGGTGTFAVATAGGCTWTASSSQSWVRITSGASGSGNGTVAFSVDATTGPARSATITAGGQTFTIQQNAGCSVAIDPSGQNFSSGGGSGSIAVTADGGCGWSAATTASWIHLGATAGSGNGTVPFMVDANPGSARSGAITVEGRSFTVQQSAGCSYSLSAQSANFGAGGGTGSVSVGSGSSCTWSASATDPWVQITSGTSGSGGGTVQFMVDPNPSGSPRTTTLSIAGQTFTINQAGACSYAINPTSQLLDAGGGSGSFAVNTAGACGWTAASSDSWLQITAGASGSGPGTVSFTAAPNAGPARTATIVAGGQTFTASQASGCTIAIAPTGQQFDAAGGSGAISVSSETGCAWSASVTSGAEWISITSGASGSGGGTVQFAVAANAGPARSGTISVGGQTFTVAQGGI